MIKVYWTDGYNEDHEVIILEMRCGGELLVVQATYNGEPVAGSRFELNGRTVKTEDQFLYEQFKKKVNVVRKQMGYVKV